MAYRKKIKETLHFTKDEYVIVKEKELSGLVKSNHINKESADNKVLGEFYYKDTISVLYKVKLLKDLTIKDM